MLRLKISLEKNCDCDKSNAATYDQGNGETEMIMMTGPMGDMYTKALSVYFRKEPLAEENTTNVATESQSQDAMIASATAAHLEKQKEQLNHIQLVTPASNLTGTPKVIAYVVPAKDSLSPETVVKVGEMYERAKARDRNVIMICDTNKATGNWMGTNANVVDDGKVQTNYETGSDFTRATEAYFEKLGIPVVIGMEGFVDWVKENYPQNKQKHTDPLTESDTDPAGM